MRRTLILAAFLAGAVALSQARGQSVTSALASPVSQADLSAASASNLAAMTAAVPGLSPVQSVNALTGAVSLPAYSRQANATPIPVSTTTGLATYTFDTAFTNVPGCYVEINATNTGYVFAQPVTTAKSTTSVTVNVQAALKLLNISLGALTVWSPAPTGTTVNFFCIAPN